MGQPEPHSPGADGAAEIRRQILRCSDDRFEERRRSGRPDPVTPAGMSSLFTTLAWLPPAPEDFRQRCAALMKAEDGIGRAIIQLASYALNDSQLHQLARAISGLRARGTDLAPLTPFRLGII